LVYCWLINFQTLQIIRIWQGSEDENYSCVYPLKDHTAEVSIWMDLAPAMMLICLIFLVSLEIWFVLIADIPSLRLNSSFLSMHIQIVVAVIVNLQFFVGLTNFWV
jgi:hypothetical protein